MTNEIFIDEVVSDSEKSEQADEEFERFARMIEAMSSPSAEDFAKLRELFRKAVDLAFKAGAEHQRVNHTCLNEFVF